MRGLSCVPVAARRVASPPGSPAHEHEPGTGRRADGRRCCSTPAPGRVGPAEASTDHTPGSPNRRPPGRVRARWLAPWRPPKHRGVTSGGRTDGASRTEDGPVGGRYRPPTGADVGVHPSRIVSAAGCAPAGPSRIVSAPRIVPTVPSRIVSGCETERGGQHVRARRFGRDRAGPGSGTATVRSCTIAQEHWQASATHRSSVCRASPHRMPARSGSSSRRRTRPGRTRTGWRLR